MKRSMLWAAGALLVELFHPPVTLAEVVADSACPKYAVDIAYFATCEGDRVAKPSASVPTAATAATPARAAEPARIGHETREANDRKRTAKAPLRRQPTSENTSTPPRDSAIRQ